MTEKFYGRVAKLFLFEAEDPADVRAIGATTLRQAAYELERAPERANWGLVRTNLSPDDVERFERRLDRLVDDFTAADTRGGVPFRLAVAFWPTEHRRA